MQILFDHQAFAIQKYGGISRYFNELINSFETPNDANLVVRFSENAYLPQIKPFLPQIDFKGKRRLYFYLNEQNSIREIRKDRYDIFHPTYYSPYFLKNLPKNKPFVATYYDMIQEKFENNYDEFRNDQILIKNKKIIADGASKLIAISETTKNDMVNILNVNPAKIEVVYLSSSFDAGRSKPVSEFDFDYLLFVGNRSLYKNFDFLIESLASVLRSDDLHLVCGGGGAFTEREQKLIKDLGLKNRVIFVDINDSLLANLYNYAIAFLFPSLYEGFGIPVLEAFACGCPCIISNTGSLPEVGGNAAVYFNPYDAESISSSVSSVLNNPNLRQEMITLGRERLKFFSKKKTYEKTMEVYRSLI